jgi:hypothetical protein
MAQPDEDVGIMFLRYNLVHYQTLKSIQKQNGIDKQKQGEKKTI